MQLLFILGLLVQLTSCKSQAIASLDDAAILNSPATSTPNITGELRQWHKVTLSFDGPQTSETNAVNPFLQYRLNVLFAKGDKSYLVPGYFSADGKAGESSGTEGNQWKVHFAPDEVGEWSYTVSFKTGKDIAVSLVDSNDESAGYMDGMTGTMTIQSSNKSGRDLRAKGRLQYVEEPYLKFAGSGEYFIKVGADAPENLLAYQDFDGDFKTDGHKDNLVKSWEPHVKDWNAGDPTWQNGKGKGLIGAINYLASKGMNAFSFLPMNIAGDDKNVFPYISYDIYDRMDVSKLDQWEVIFEHADQLGLFLHFKTSEVENQGLLDNGELGVQRKLYYRELIARFGHHLALNWNIGEENGKWMKKHPTPYQTTTQRLACAQYFYDHDPYRHHVVIHNGQAFYDIMGPESKYTGLSVQTHKPDFSHVYGAVRQWRALSDRHKLNWAIAVDEPGDAQFSVVPDNINPDHDNARQNALWGAIMAGAWGVEWYFGYKHEHSDLSLQDFRSRDNMWTQSKYLLDFFQQRNIPFWTMRSKEELTDSKTDYILASETEYVVYLKIGDEAKSELMIPSGNYETVWYNAKEGIFLDVTTASVGADGLSLMSPDLAKDWAVHVKLVE